MSLNSDFRKLNFNQLDAGLRSALENPFVINESVNSVVTLTSGNERLEMTYRECIAKVEEFLKAKKPIQSTLRTLCDYLPFKTAFTNPSSLEIIRIERKLLALKSRVALHNQSAKLGIEERALRLRKLVSDYKRNPKCYAGHDGELSSFDLNQISFACGDSPELVENLLLRHAQDKKDLWVGAFVKFCFRSPESSQRSAREWIKIFEQFPVETDQISSVHLDKRCGAVDPSLIKIETEGGVVQLALKIDGVYQRIQSDAKFQNEKKFSLKNRFKPESGGIELSLKEIYAQFKSKTYGYEDIEVVESDGIVNLNTIELVSKNSEGKVDGFERPEDVSDKVAAELWLKSLPVFKTLTKEELTVRYGKTVALAGQEFGVAIRANREDASLEILKTHAFLELVVPGDVSDTYKIYPFGFQATTLPKTLKDKYKFFMGGFPARIHYPDEGVYLTQRQHETLLMKLSAEEKASFLTRIYEFSSKAQQGHKYFQANNKNCGYVVENLILTGIFPEYKKGLEAFLPESQKPVTFKERALDKFYSIFAPKRMYRDKHTLVNHLLKHLDASVLTTKIYPEIDRCVDTQDTRKLHALLSHCFKVTKAMNQYTEELGEVSEAQIKSFLERNPSGAVPKEMIKKAVALSWESIEPYKIPLFGVQVKMPIVNIIFRTTRALWERIRAPIMRVIFFFLFSSWSGHSYRKRNQDVAKTSRVFREPLHRNSMLHLPAQFFEWKKKVPERQNQFRALYTKIRGESL